MLISIFVAEDLKILVGVSLFTLPLHFISQVNALGYLILLKRLREVIHTYLYLSNLLVSFLDTSLLLWNRLKLRLKAFPVIFKCLALIHKPCQVTCIESRFSVWKNIV